MDCVSIPAHFDGQQILLDVPCEWFGFLSSPAWKKNDPRRHTKGTKEPTVLRVTSWIVFLRPKAKQFESF